MPDPELKIEGLEAFQSSLRRAADDIQELKGAAAKTAALIEAAARSRAPRRSGRLASSISGTVEGGRASLNVTAAYAGPIHWGWPARHIDPQPFAMQAARATEAQWVKFYEAEVQEALDKVKGA